MTLQRASTAALPAHAVGNGEQLLIEATERTMRLLLLGAAVSSSVDTRRQEVRLADAPR
ncbi:hypothetical protein [Arthrobacter sp. B1805]|uniref:hypothetical protein n=1 Tax=Arthrobacter sp. B1805 TaxID=2058892 RepID=UPI0015E3B5A1|nr:hypothetical protein [Arthrobacter sp. B1805]